MKDQDTYNRGGMIAFVFSMVFSLAFFVYLALMSPGIDLKEVPAEAVEAKPAAQAVAGADAGGGDISGITKPWEANDKMAAHGAQVFKANCAVCHGEKGMGDGPAGKTLVPPPRNLVEGKWKKAGDSISLFTTVKDGLPGTAMAPFGHLPINDRWAIVQFIRSITNNKGKDDPAKLEAFAKGAK